MTTDKTPVLRKRPVIKSKNSRNILESNENSTLVPEAKKPWEEPEVSERVLKSVLIKMPEPLKLKLDYVLDNTPGRRSMQEFILELVSDAVEEKLMELNGKSS